jgi:hypothetical protein
MKLNFCEIATQWDGVAISDNIINQWVDELVQKCRRDETPTIGFIHSGDTMVMIAPDDATGVFRIFDLKVDRILSIPMRP